MATNTQKLFELGQSIWYDNIERRVLKNGELAAMIERGDIYGVTSNPSIFNKAVGESKDYDEDIAVLAEQGRNVDAIYEALTFDDIRAATDLFSPLYGSTRGGDGFVSIEVHPDLAGDTQGSLDQARHFWTRLERPNLMVKIPGTQAGLEAIRASIAEGININITLIFSRQRYAEVIDAYFSGLEQRVEEGKAIDSISSVASFFVSRIDGKVDGWLEEIVQSGGEKGRLAASLQGKVAIANAKLAYQLFKEQCAGARFKALEAKGAQVQRPLWASTSTKNPAYPDVQYVDELIGAQTVNTVPPETLQGFLDHGSPELSIERDLEGAHQVMADLETLGLSLDQATDELEAEGVDAFSKSIHQLLDTIRDRRRILI